LVKEFAFFVFDASKGSRFAIVNSGRAGEQKIDIAVIKKNTGAGPEIAESFIEAKYFRNRHRLSQENAVDEHETALSDLKRQISIMPGKMHGFHEVGLRSKTTQVYGLVFVSYARCLDEADSKEEYYKKFLKKSGEYDFRYHDLEKPYLRSIYEDVTITVLQKKWKISLRGALWRSKD